MTRNSFRLGHKKIGPFRVNFGKTGKAGVTSVSLDTGILNFRLWSANGQRGISSIDTPGWGSIRRDLPTTKQKLARAAAAQDQPVDETAARRTAARAAARRNAEQQAAADRIRYSN